MSTTSITRKADRSRVADRPVYGTRKHRAEDLVSGDVVRNGHGRWDRIVAASPSSSKITEAKYVDVAFEVGGMIQLRTVDLVDVQIVKPS